MSSAVSAGALHRLGLHYSLLQKEYEYEKEEYRRQAEKGGLYKNIRQGICWYPISAGRTYYNSLNQLVIEVERHEATDIDHTFEYGKPVCFFSQTFSGEIRYFTFSATVSYVFDNRMVVSLPQAAAAADLQQCASLGVQLYFDETSYRTMFHALNDVMLATGNRTAELREILSGSVAARFRDTLPMRFPWLNATQEAAVNRVLQAKDVAIVHGPPGTGKTTTLVEAVFETLHRENQVLVCAQSNTAVDWIAEKLTDRGIPVLRVGNPTRVNDKMLSFTFERRFESHADYPELWNIRKAIREAYARKPGAHADRETWRNRLSKLRNRAAELEMKITEELFSEARVVASTLVGSANRVLNGRRFSTLFIDEAAQALEAACWIAARKADRVILAGDPCQLPPTVKCIEAAREGLGRTLIEQLVTRQPATVSLLRIQYRMHEAIMGFPSRWFYHGSLQSAPNVKNRGILQLDHPVEWYDTAAMLPAESCPPDSLSRMNREEAELLVDRLKSYMQKIGEFRISEEQIDFGLISPYQAQVRYLRRLVRKDAFFRPFRSLIAIHTVDGFQGQERDVIFISLVRANESGQIGFLGDLRRMNVAMTRARMKLVIIGDATTLARHAFYRELYRYVGQYGRIIEAAPAPAHGDSLREENAGGGKK